ncbi:DUF2157 domain-containing protein [Brevibacillus sp. H7]|uniref:DUF2157 domain-containing protein n=1 Tax=Brevibacillus sp. H7 TaxID=3349138 RepID=UPI0037FA3EF4
MDKRKWILQEASRWREEGIITEGQLEQLVSRYPEEPKANALPLFAAILIGLGVLTFVASNWQEIGAFFRMAIIFSAMTAAYAGGEVLRRQGYDRIGLALTAVGIMIYGAGFFLIGQTYHLSANPVNAFYLWLIGAVAMTWHYRSHFLAFLSVLIWFVSALYGADSGDRDGQTMAVFYLLFAFGIAPLAWKFRSRWVTIPALSVLYVYTLYDVRHIGEGLVFPAVLMVFLLAALLLERYHEQLAQTLRVLGYLAVMILGIIVIFTEDEWLQTVTRMDTLLAGWGLFTAAAYVFLAMKRRRQELAADVIPLGGFLLAYLTAWVGEGSLSAGVLMIVSLFLFSIGLVLGGERMRDIARINTGAIFFGLTCLVGYVNFAWDFLDKSLFFLLGGVLLLALSFFLERQRRKWVHDARRDGQ